MPDVPTELLDRLRPVCLGLPEAYEEPAWTGLRWRVRTRTFAHVFTVDADSPSVLAGALGGVSGRAGNLTAVTFRAPGDELEALRNAGPPFYDAGWGRDVIGLRLDGGTDWAEVSELLTDSFCLLAPAKLVARVTRPSDPTA